MEDERWVNGGGIDAPAAAAFVPLSSQQQLLDRKGKWMVSMPLLLQNVILLLIWENICC
jgi:hypothetical protein